MNKPIQDFLRKAIEDKFDDDYDDAAAKCIKLFRPHCDWELDQLAQLNKDDCTFLT